VDYVDNDLVAPGHWKIPRAEQTSNCASLVWYNSNTSTLIHPLKISRFNRKDRIRIRNILSNTTPNWKLKTAIMCECVAWVCVSPQHPTDRGQELTSIVPDECGHKHLARISPCQRRNPDLCEDADITVQKCFYDCDDCVEREKSKQDNRLSYNRHSGAHCGWGLGCLRLLPFLLQWKLLLYFCLTGQERTVLARK